MTVTAFEQFEQAASLPLKIDAVFQWPLQREKAKTNPNFSIDFPQDRTGYAQGVAGFVDATPNPCTLGAAGNCSVTVSWTSANAPDACLYVQTGALFACGSQGSEVVPCIGASPTNFTMHASKSAGSLLLGSIQVAGRAAGAGGSGGAGVA